MSIVVIIDLVVVGTLVYFAMRKGLAEALPYFVFFAVVLPQESRIRLAGAFDLYTTRLALITLLVLFLIRRKQTSSNPLPLKQLIYVHIGWALISTLFSIVFMASVKQLLAQVAEYYLLYYIIFKTITDVKTITKIAYAMVAGMTLCSVFGLLEIYAHWSVLSLFPQELQRTYGGSALYAEMFDRGIRARATFPHPIHFGGALAMTIPFTFYLASTSQGFKKIYLNASLFLMFLALYKSASRGPWLATVCALAVLTLGAEPKLRKRIIGVAAATGAILLLRPGILDTLINMYRATLDTHSMMGSSFEYRPVLFHTVTHTLNSDLGRAVIGFGLESFREKGLVLVMPGIDTHRWFTCDSTWILFAYETGYVGLLILASLLIRPALLAWGNLRRLAKPDRALSLVFLSSLISFYVVMISVAIYGWGQNGYMLWTVIGISISYTALKSKEAATEVMPNEDPQSSGEAVDELALAGRDQWFLQLVEDGHERQLNDRPDVGTLWH